MSNVLVGGNEICGPGKTQLGPPLDHNPGSTPAQHVHNRRDQHLGSFRLSGVCVYDPISRGSCCLICSSDLPWLIGWLVPTRQRDGDLYGGGKMLLKGAWENKNWVYLAAKHPLCTKFGQNFHPFICIGKKIGQDLVHNTYIYWKNWMSIFKNLWK